MSNLASAMETKQVGKRWSRVCENILVGLDEARYDAEFNLAIDNQINKLPYIIEVMITPGKVESFFEIKKQSCIQIDVVVFSNAEELNKYLDQHPQRNEKNHQH